MKCLIRQLFVKVIIFNGGSVFRFKEFVVCFHLSLATERLQNEAKNLSSVDDEKRLLKLWK